MAEAQGATSSLESSETRRRTPRTLTNRDIGTWDTISAGLFGTLPEAWISQRGLLTPEQEALLRALIGDFGEGGGATPFQGEFVAPLGDLEGLSLEALEQKILQRAQGEGPEAEAGAAFSKVLRTGGAPVDFEDYFQKVIRDPALQEFSEMILPELTRRFGSSGAFGSDRRLAEQQATERFGKTLAGARSELAFKTQSAAADRLIQALGLAPGMETASTESLLKLMQGASLPRSIQQARLTSEYGEFQRQQEERRKRLELLLGVKGVQNIPQSTAASGGIVSQFLGGGRGGGGGGFF